MDPSPIPVSSSNRCSMVCLLQIPIQAQEQPTQVWLALISKCRCKWTTRRASYRGRSRHLTCKRWQPTAASQAANRTRRALRRTSRFSAIVRASRKHSKTTHQIRRSWTQLPCQAHRVKSKAWQRKRDQIKPRRATSKKERLGTRQCWRWRRSTKKRIAVACQMDRSMTQMWRLVKTCFSLTITGRHKIRNSHKLNL